MIRLFSVLSFCVLSGLVFLGNSNAAEPGREQKLIQKQCLTSMRCVGDGYATPAYYGDRWLDIKNLTLEVTAKKKEIKIEYVGSVSGKKVSETRVFKNFEYLMSPDDFECGMMEFTPGGKHLRGGDHQELYELIGNDYEILLKDLDTWYDREYPKGSKQGFVILKHGQDEYFGNLNCWDDQSKAVTFHWPPY